MSCPLFYIILSAIRSSDVFGRTLVHFKYVFPGFVTPLLTQLSLQRHRRLFSHASAKIRRKESSPQPDIGPPGHESGTLTTELDWPM